jgi:hypothetical protein
MLIIDQASEAGSVESDGIAFEGDAPNVVGAGVQDFAQEFQG